MSTIAQLPEMSHEERSQFAKTFDVLAHPTMQPPAVEMSGFWLRPYFSAFWIDTYNFPFRQDDILINSFPKSGTCWVNYIVELLIQEKNPEVVPLRPIGIIEDPFVFGSIKAAKRSRENPLPRVLLTHLPYPLWPKDAFKAKIIYVRRDPKDVAVSYYHFTKGFTDIQANSQNDSFENFVECFIDGKIVFGPYPKHVNCALEAKKAHPSQVYIVQYEAMKMNPHKEIKALAKFLNFEDVVDDAAIARICEKTSFDAMKVNDDVNWADKVKSGVWSKDVDFIRKGQVGDWQNHFASEDQLKRFEEAITHQLLD